MLNQELELSLNMAFARAREHRHEFMTVEHLFSNVRKNLFLFTFFVQPTCPCSSQI